MYGFDSWSCDSIILLPGAYNEGISFEVTQGDSIKLNLYKKPTIVYTVNPIGTTTSIDINGNIISAFPYSENVLVDDLITLNPTIDPNYTTGYWSSNYNTFLNGAALNNSFYGVYNDSITLHLSTISAFISGDDTICENDYDAAKVNVAFSGSSPFTFNFTINGVLQPSITTTINPYIIYTKAAGNYSLVSYNDANEFGSTNGQAIVTVLKPPNAEFDVQPDSTTILFPNAQMIDRSLGNIFSWEWDFGDNTSNKYIQNPFHSYIDSIGIYQISLIIYDENECSDTAQNFITITDEYWIYIPNSFSPDNDGVNDKFCLSHNGIRQGTFKFNVFDRFSNLVFATDNINDLSCENGWKGTHYKTDNELPMGAYIYQIYYQDLEGWKYQEASKLMIVR